MARVLPSATSHRGAAKATPVPTMPPPGLPGGGRPHHAASPADALGGAGQDQQDGGENFEDQTEDCGPV